MWGMKSIHHSPIHPQSLEDIEAASALCYFYFFLFSSKKFGCAHHGLDCSKGTHLLYEFLVAGGMLLPPLPFTGISSDSSSMSLGYIKLFMSSLVMSAPLLFPTLSNSFHSFSFSTPAIELCSCRRSCPSSSAAKPLAVFAMIRLPFWPTTAPPDFGSLNCGQIIPFLQMFVADRLSSNDVTRTSSKSVTVSKFMMGSHTNLAHKFSGHTTLEENHKTQKWSKVQRFSTQLNGFRHAHKVNIACPCACDNSHRRTCNRVAAEAIITKKRCWAKINQGHSRTKNTWRLAWRHYDLYILYTMHHNPILITLHSLYI